MSGMHTVRPDFARLRRALLVAMFPTVLLYGYLPVDIARKNVSLFAISGPWFAIVAVALVVSYAGFTVLGYLAARENTRKISAGDWPFLAVLVWCQLALLQPLTATHALPVALALDVAAAAVLVAVFSVVGTRPVLSLVEGLAVVPLGMTAWLVWGTPFMSVGTLAAAGATPTTIETYERELAPPVAPPDRPNVYHVLLDGFQQQILEPALELLDPPTRARLADFRTPATLVTDSWSTQWSMATLFGGERFAGDGAWHDYERRAFQEGWLVDLADAGVRIHQYVIDPYMCLFGRSACRHNGELWDLRVGDLPLVDLAFLVALPGSVRVVLEGRPLQQANTWSVFFSITSQLLGAGTTIGPDDLPAHMPRFLNLMTDDEDRRAARGYYVFVHLLTPHAPWITDRDCAYRGLNWSTPAREVIEQHACALRLLSEIVARLQSLGRYEDALMVVHADHGAMTLRGAEVNGLTDLLPASIGRTRDRLSNRIATRTAGLLLVKSSAQGPVDLEQQRFVQFRDLARVLVEHWGVALRPALHPEEGGPIQVLITDGYGFGTIPTQFGLYTMRSEGVWGFVRSLTPSDGGRPWEGRRSPARPIGHEAEWNILALLNHVVAVRDGLGAIDFGVDRYSDKAMPPAIVRAGSEEALAAAVHELGHTPAEYDIARVEDVTVGVLKSWGGRADELIGTRTAEPWVMVARDEASARVAVQSAQARPLGPPRLIEVLDGHNIVGWRMRFWGIPHGIPIDWDRQDPASVAGVIVASDLETVRQAIRAVATPTR
jgi:hypothetical protein